MQEYDFLNWMLCKKYLASSQSKMVEKDIQTVQIDQGRNVPYTLYRLEAKKNADFIPFFNQTDDAPKNLRAFCDYVILTECQGRTYVLLVELKSGDAGHASCQLDASQCFVDYLLNTADRIKAFNNCDFNKDAVHTVKIVVKPIKTRRTTRIGDNPQIKDNGGYLSYATTSFNLFYVCRFAENL